MTTVPGRWRPLLVTTLRLAVPLYLSTAIFGLLPLVVVMLGLVPLAGDRPWTADLLSPGWMNLAVEIFMSARQSSDLSLLVIAIVLGVVAVPLAMFGQTVAYSLLAGGILEALRADDGPAPPLWLSCRRWFWPSFRLSLLGGVVIIVVTLAGVAVTGFAQRAVGPEGGVLLQFAVQALVLGWLELARAQLVIAGDRSVGRALRRAVRGFARPPVLALWLLLAVPGSAFMAASLFTPTVNDPYAWLEFVKALAFGQALAFLGSWWKVVRLAAALWIARPSQPAPVMHARAPTPAAE